MATIAKFEQSNLVTINGVTMTMAEYKKLRKAKTATKKTTRVSRNISADNYSEVMSAVENMLKSVNVIGNFKAYHTHCYRQWGRTIMGKIYTPIQTPMVLLSSKIDELHKLASKVLKLANKGEKSVFQYVQKLAWTMEDISALIDRVSQTAIKSGIFQQFGSHEAINGNGRRLGLRTIIRRTNSATINIYKSVEKLNKLADNGEDVFNYTINGKKVWG